MTSVPPPSPPSSSTSHGSPEYASGGRTPVLEAFSLGPVETNCYLVRVPDALECWIVDPGYGPEEVVERARELGLRPAAIVLTHAHADHIAGIPEVLRAFPGTPVLLHAAESAWLNDPMLNLSAMMGLPIGVPGPDRTLEDASELDLAGTRWLVMHTPGHSPGSVTLYHAPSRQALVGDLIFSGSVGRTDFPGCDGRAMVESIQRRIYTLPDEVRLLPGHGPATTVGREKRSNPFVRG